MRPANHSPWKLFFVPLTFLCLCLFVLAPQQTVVGQSGTYCPTPMGRTCSGYSVCTKSGDCTQQLFGSCCSVLTPAATYPTNTPVATPTPQSWPYTLRTFYQFNDNTSSATITKSSVSPTYDGTNSGVTYTTTGAIDGGTGVFGGSQFFTIPHNSILNQSTEFSLSAWIKPSAVAAEMPIVSKKGSAGNYSYEFVRTSAGKLSLVVSDDGLTITTYTSISSVTDGIWQKVTVTYNSGTVVFYVNSTAEASQANSLSAPYASTADVLVGKNIAGSFFTGQMDEVCMYGQQLSSTDIATLAGTTCSGTPRLASSGVIATGGTITNVGGYRIHTFTSGGTFTVTQGGYVEYLVVAGGGGGGGPAESNYGYGGGGGGAGGYQYSTGSVTAQAYTITVGGGGSGGGVTTNGTAGSNSSALGTTSIGGGYGGYGGYASASNGGNGGSGGGAGGPATAKTGGTGTAGQGSTGGNTPTSSTSGSSGGSGGGATGAGAVGAIASNIRTVGGAGATSGISGSSATYAVGGDGGQYAGGGSGTAGAANTGDGGDGANGLTGTSASGGSGIVIIRYFYDNSPTATPTSNFTPTPTPTFTLALTHVTPAVVVAGRPVQWEVTVSNPSIAPQAAWAFNLLINVPTGVTGVVWKCEVSNVGTPRGEMAAYPTSCAGSGTAAYVDANTYRITLGHTGAADPLIHPGGSLKITVGGFIKKTPGITNLTMSASVTNYSGWTTNALYSTNRLANSGPQAPTPALTTLVVPTVVPISINPLIGAALTATPTPTLYPVQPTSTSTPTPTPTLTPTPPPVVRSTCQDTNKVLRTLVNNQSQYYCATATNDLVVVKGTTVEKLNGINTQILNLDFQNGGVVNGVQLVRVVMKVQSVIKVQGATQPLARDYSLVLRMR